MNKNLQTLKLVGLLSLSVAVSACSSQKKKTPAPAAATASAAGARPAGGAAEGCRSKKRRYETLQRGNYQQS